MPRTFARTALLLSIMFVAVLVCTTTSQTARADGPAKQTGAAAKPKPKTAKRTAKPAVKSADKKRTAKPRSKAAPKRVPRQRVPRAIGPKPVAPAKATPATPAPETPAPETPTDGETAPSEREKNAGKLDGRKWRPRRRP